MLLLTYLLIYLIYIITYGWTDGCTEDHLGRVTVAVSPFTGEQSEAQGIFSDIVSTKRSAAGGIE